MRSMLCHMLVLIALLTVNSSAFADSPLVVIKVSANGRIHLEVTATPLGTVLDNLEKHLDVQVTGDLRAEDESFPSNFSVSGDLDQVLGRLLKNYNHISSMSDNSRILQISILGPTGPRDITQDVDPVLANIEPSSSQSNGDDTKVAVGAGGSVESGVRGNTDTRYESDSQRSLTDVSESNDDTSSSASKQIAQFLAGNQFATKGRLDTPPPAKAGPAAISNSGSSGGAPEITPEMQAQLKVLTQQATANIRALAEQLKKNDQALSETQN